MLKAAGRTGDGRPFVLLGLTGDSMTRLMADEPIVVELKALGLPDVQVAIAYRKNAKDLIADVMSSGSTKTADGTSA